MPHLFTSILKDRHWDAVLISSLPNVRYLTGFTGSNALALALPDQMILFTDPRYTIQSKKEFPGRTVIVKGPLVAGMKRWLGKIPTLAFENERILFHTQQAVAAELPKRAKMEGMGPLLEELRMVKSAAEIALIRRAVEINSTAFEAAMALARDIISRPQSALRTDRLSAYEQWSMSLDDVLKSEFNYGMTAIESGELFGGLSNYSEGAWREPPPS